MLNQSAGETDLRYDATQEAYYYDVDGDAAHDTDGTEGYLDLLVVEVPGDYANVQAAIDSNDCKKGSTTAHQGCRIRVAPGTYAEVFEIGSAALVSGDYQNSIVVEGRLHWRPVDSRRKQFVRGDVHRKRCAEPRHYQRQRIDRLGDPKSMYRHGRIRHQRHPIWDCDR